MSNRHWSSYWAQGHLTSLPQDFQGNYDGEIARFWQCRFAELGDGASILDACSGNGAVALLAAAYGNHSFEVTAVDAADISPPEHPEAPFAAAARNVKFIGGCRFEDLDCPDESFDLITSQYGLEYCEEDASAATAARLLKPGGTIALLSHAATSEILKTMVSEQAQYACLADLNILYALEALTAGRVSEAGFIGTLEQAAPALRREFERSGSELYGYVLGMVEQVIRMDAATLRGHWAPLVEMGKQLSHGHDRLRDMLRVNRMIAADPDWHQVFSRRGLDFVESGDVHYRGRHHSGRFYVYRKPLA